MTKTRLFNTACLTAGLMLMAATAQAQDEKIFDNANLAACDVTDHAGFQLDAPAYVARIALWYHWAPNESTVAYTLSQDGQQISSGTLTRASCDPYQTAWCNAEAEIDVDLEPGFVEVQTGRAQVCQNAGTGGEGTIRVYGSMDQAGPQDQGDTPPDPGDEPNDPGGPN